jgi:hypothetical protein
MQDVFQAAGVTVPVHIIPEPVDVKFFNPADVGPLPLPAGELVFGQRLAHAQPHTKLLSVSVSSLSKATYSVGRSAGSFKSAAHVGTCRT